MRKNLIALLATLLILISIMVIGYSAFASQLTLNGTAEIVGDWNVKIVDIKVHNVSESANPGTPEYTDTTASFNAKLKKPGDTITYAITIQNAGSIDAKLESADFVPDDNGSPAIVYETNNPAEILKAGEETTFYVFITYDSTYEGVPEIKTKNITATINYAQE